MNAPTTLVLGGARSGKTARALALCKGFESPIYIATAQAGDDEMSERIKAHQAERGAKWKTVEAPICLPKTLLDLHTTPHEQRNLKNRIVLIDCLTLWLSNLMMADHDIKAETDALCDAIKTNGSPLVLVSNEVGLGIVPDNPLARSFRDAQGILNQRVAAISNIVELVTAGLPMRLKP